MTYIEAQKFINKHGYLTIKGIKYEVIIRDYKVSYGRPRYFVEPVSGEGKRWVLDVKLKDGAKARK